MVFFTYLMTLRCCVYATSGTDINRNPHYSSTIPESKKGHRVIRSQGGRGPLFWCFRDKASLENEVCGINLAVLLENANRGPRSLGAGWQHTWVENRPWESCVGGPPNPRALVWLVEMEVVSFTHGRWGSYPAAPWSGTLRKSKLSGVCDTRSEPTDCCRGKGGRTIEGHRLFWVDLWFPAAWGCGTNWFLMTPFWW